ncbi:methyltransferase domain-containing protein [Biscogniauxia marginata]|nr:methyltransferase domain-containing protein [Biscogniauxia marginata]
MLPTPDTSHVAYERIYEPAEDSFLLLDTLSSAGETAFLHRRFGSGEGAATPPPPPPLVVEIGPGSGVVIAFVNAHARTLFGPGPGTVLTAAVDVSAHACAATNETVRRAAAEHAATRGRYLGAVQGDLAAALADGAVDVLVFNPPYVPTPEPPPRGDVPRLGAAPSFDDDSYLLELTYAGGRDGMETTDRLLASLPRVLSGRGCAYVLLCAQNRPEEVKERIRGLGHAWRVETVGTSGRKAGWEKLQIIRIWREVD